MNKSILTILSVTAILAGCAGQQQQTWKAMSGSKADGTLTLAYTQSKLDMFSTPPSPAQGQAVADQRCKSWGYTKAVAFDFISEKCQSQSSGGGVPTLFGGGNSCDENLITQKYQCEK